MRVTLRAQLSSRPFVVRRCERGLTEDECIKFGILMDRPDERLKSRRTISNINKIRIASRQLTGGVMKIEDVGGGMFSKEREPFYLSRSIWRARAHVCVAAAFVGCASLTFAQEEVGREPSSHTVGSQRSDDQLQEIVVTAEKRAGSVQDTPISLTALTGAELQAQGITNLEDAARQVPGVAETSAGPGQTEYTIRGLSSTGPAVATVGFYLDDVPMTAPTGSQNGHVVIDPNLYDLNRVEVLRGPQGTLYGSGSMGGTIKLVTNQPELGQFRASAQVDGSDTDGGGFNHSVNGMVNLPLIDGKLALRIVATDSYTSGWIDRIVLADFPMATNPEPQCGGAGCTRGNVLAAPVSADYHNVNDEELKGARATLRYQATDNFSVTVGALYQTISQDGLNNFDSPPGTEAHYQPLDLAEPFSDAFRLYDLTADLALPAFSVTSTTAYWTRSQSQVQDASEEIQSAFGLPSYYVGAGGVGAVPMAEIDYSKQFSEEIRFTSTGDGPLQWLIGGFYSDNTYTRDQYSIAAGLVPVFGWDNLYTELAGNYLKQNAAFGEISYKLADGFKATLGLRRYSYTQNGFFTTSGIAATAIPETINVAASDSGLNPKFTLSYDISKEFLAYATAAKGFRPGAGNGPVPTSGTDSCLPYLEALGKTTAPTQYKPDSLWSYELGEKATLWNKRLTINSDVYYERWTNVQQNLNLGCGYGYIDNVGSAAVRGAEIELNAKLSSSWTVSQSGGYTHAVITSTEPGTGVLVGQKLLNVPTYSATTSIIYEHPIVADYTLVARGSYVAVGSSESLSYFLTPLPSYDIANFRIGVTAPQWSTFLYVNNATNKMAELSNVPAYALFIPSVNRIATNQPRTAGITIEYHY